MFMLQLLTSVDFVQRPWNIWEDGIGLYHMQIICYNVDCIHFFQDIGQWYALCKYGDEKIVFCGM